MLLSIIIFFFYCIFNLLDVSKNVCYLFIYLYIVNYVRVNEELGFRNI